MFGSIAHSLLQLAGRTRSSKQPAEHRLPGCLCHLQVEASVSKGFTRIAGTAAGGILAYVVMLKPALSTRSVPLAVILLFVTFLAGCAAQTQFKVNGNWSALCSCVCLRAELLLPSFQHGIHDNLLGWAKQPLLCHY